MTNTLSNDILQLFHSESSNILLSQIYDKIKDQYPNKEPTKLKHSIRRAIQSLSNKNTIVRIGHGKYSLVS